MSSLVRLIIWMTVAFSAVAVIWYTNRLPAAESGPQPPADNGAYLFIAGGGDPYWELCIAGARAAAEEHGAELVVHTPESEGQQGLQEQLGWLTTFDPKEYDGVAIGPIDPARQTTLINRAAEKATVVTVDSDVPGSRRMFYIGSSNYEAGMIAARNLVEALPDGGKVVVLMASDAKTNAVERRQGLIDELHMIAADGEGEPTGNEADPGEAKLELPITNGSITIIDIAMDGGDPAAAKQNVLDALADDDDLAAVVGTFGYHGPMILEALKEADKTSAVQVIAFDEAEPTLAGVEQGHIHATIVQDPFMFGAEAIGMLEKVRQGKFLSLPVASGAVGVHCRAVTKENLAEFREQLEKRLASSDAEAITSP